MRKPTDLCMLCDKKHATQSNSHIIPKFISSDFLGTKSNKRGFVIDSISGQRQVIQDSPKEDFILCPDCESFFSIIEGEVASDLKRLHAESEGDQYEVLESATIPPKIFHLFYFSQFWRASISSHEIFKSFKLSTELEKQLKEELNKFYASDKASFHNILDSNELGGFLPYGIFTTFEFLDKTKNLIFAPGTSFPFSLIVDKFGLLLYSDAASIPLDMQSLFNTDMTHRRVSVLPSLIWEELMINTPMRIITSKYLGNQVVSNKLKSLANQLSKLTNQQASHLKEILDSDFGIK